MASRMIKLHIFTGESLYIDSDRIVAVLGRKHGEVQSVVYTEAHRIGDRIEEYHVKEAPEAVVLMIDEAG